MIGNTKFDNRHKKIKCIFITTHDDDRKKIKLKSDLAIRFQTSLNRFKSRLINIELSLNRDKQYVLGKNYCLNGN